MSRGTGKEELAKKLGAKRFIDTTDGDQLKANAGALDQLTVTAGGAFDPDKCLPLLKTCGNLHFSSLATPPITFNMTPIVFAGQSVTGYVAWEAVLTHN